jgi:acetyl esterase
MPVDPKLQTLLDAAKALGHPPTHELTPELARQHRAEMMERFVAMPEYAGVRVEARTIVVEAEGSASADFASRGAGREIGVRVYTPPGGERGPLPVMVFFHGGGWVTGTLETHDPYCRALATEADVVVVSVDYRLAPEHKFPAAVEDCTAATEWVLAHAGELGGDASRVMVGGDSAGATLAAVAALLLRDKGVTGLVGQMLLYPIAGYYDPPTGSYLENAEGYGLTRKAMIWFWDHYLNDKAEGKDFRAAPLLAASLAGLPRAFVVTAEYDVLRDEGQAYARRMADEGVKVTHVFVPGMNHAFAASANEFPFLTQAKDVLRQAAGWVNAG